MDNNMPSLGAELRNATETQLYVLIDGHVSTGTRALRVREEWQTVQLASTAVAPDMLAVARFARMVSSLTVPQAHLPARTQTAAMLHEKILSATRGKFFTQNLVTACNDYPHAVVAHIKLLLTAGPAPAASDTASRSPCETLAFLADTVNENSPRP